jgi:hypothetical protein
MDTFIYKVIDSSAKRGFNKTIVVYRMLDNEPIHLAVDEKINTGSYTGDRGCVNQLIADNCEGYEMIDSYTLNKSVRLYSV